MTHEHEWLDITPPIPWADVRKRPELNGHMREGAHSGRQVIRVSGPHDRADADGYLFPWDDRMTPGAVDRVTLAYVSHPEPEDWDQRLLAQLQKLLNAFPGHTFTGDIDLNPGHAPVERQRRLAVRDARAVILRPTITWEEP